MNARPSREIVVALTAAGVRTRPLTVSHAFHSPLMRPMIEAFEAEVRAVEFLRPEIPIVSCVEGVFAPDAMATPAYWTRQVLEPVRFLQAMATLQQAGIGAYVEIGPQPVLTGLGRQCLGAAASDAVWVPSIKRDADEWQTVLGSAGQLHVAGVPLGWRGVAAPASPAFVSLPRYAFDTRAHWVVTPAVGPAAPAASTRLSDVGVYQLTWQVIPPSVVPAASGGTWLVIAAGDAVSDALARSLTAAGGHCVTIPAGRDRRPRACWSVCSRRTRPCAASSTFVVSTRPVRAV